MKTITAILILLSIITNGQEVNFHIRDYQSSLRSSIDQSNQVTTAVTYTSYGEIVSIETSDLATNYFYTGQEYDAETGLHNFKARWYDSHQKLFLSVDPLLINPSPYVYVNNNPVNLIDNSGKAPNTPLKLTKKAFLRGAKSGRISKPLIGGAASHKSSFLRVNKDGMLFNKTSGNVLAKSGGNTFNYVMHQNGEIKFSQLHSKQYQEAYKSQNHAQLADEYPVASGKLKISRGKLSYLDEESEDFASYGRTGDVLKQLEAEATAAGATPGSFKSPQFKVNPATVEISDAHRVPYETLEETRQAQLKFSSHIPTLEATGISPEDAISWDHIPTTAARMPTPVEASRVLQEGANAKTFSIDALLRE